MSPSIPVIVICCPTHPKNVHINAFLIPYYPPGIFPLATDLYWLALSGILETDLSRIEPAAGGSAASCKAQAAVESC
jgi:hypothetical protein